MKIIDNLKNSDNRKNSEAYLQAVIALRDKKDELLKQKSSTLAKITEIRAKLDDVEKKMSTADDAQTRKNLRIERADLQEALEDHQSINLDIFGRLKAMNEELAPLRSKCWDELDAATSAADKQIEAIKAKAHQDILDVRFTIESHPFQKADRIIQNIIGYGGWQEPSGGYVDEPRKFEVSPDGPDRLMNDPRYAEVKPAPEGWVGTGFISRQ